MSAPCATRARRWQNLVLVGDLLRSYPPAAIRLLLLDRPWKQDREYHGGDLDAAAADLEILHAAAGRPNRSANAVDVVTAPLLDDLDVPSALAIARQKGERQHAGYCICWRCPDRPRVPG